MGCRQRYGGAPAIAIVTALSLAVEVYNLKVFDGSSRDAADFLFGKLDYLVSSRPTAVNLSDAASKSKEIVTKAAATASKTISVFQAYTEAAKIMLKDGVASNKSYEVKLLLKQIKKSDKISILTHCNTGRSVSAEGFLEKAYWLLH